LSVDLAALERTLRAGPWPAGVADAVVALTGQVTVRGESAARRAGAWAAATEAFAPALEAHPSLRPWFDRWISGGGHKRIARAQASRLGRGDASPEELAAIAREVLGAAARVMVALPVPGELRAVFARRTLGDAHGLDRARPVATVVGAAIQALTACDDVRGAWEAVGIGRSALASTVLCLGVPGVIPGPWRTGDASHAAVAPATIAALEAARAVPLALVLTAEQVMCGAVAPVDGHGVVFVCENPSILELAAAALREAPAGSPAETGGCRACLICVSGQPSVAATDLLARVSAAGAHVRYHGDFDWAGLRIAGTLARSIDWTPWRFGAADYRAAADIVSGPSPVRLTGPPAESAWDPDLAVAMGAAGVAVEEEAVVEVLIDDVLAAW
jgi:uncharacterized protein (TIGR02679 family)